ncbi:hypothetical protein SmphiM6_27 [Sinorhizobium phage phiM6]|nr:hypothetical protein SmphiM6_27 [Sinorhizobium phage phiM6]
MAVSAGPIPGSNFTSDTKSYPWHQPPEFTDINKALDMLGDKITEFKVANGLLVFVELGAPLYKVAQMILMQGVAEGKWTPDFALLLAGPLTRMIELICIGFDVEYDIGIDDDPDDFETGTFFKKQRDSQTAGTNFVLLDQEIGEIKEAAEAQNENAEGTKTQDLGSQGFMAMAGGTPNNEVKE